MTLKIRRSLLAALLSLVAVSPALAATPACAPVTEAMRHSHAVPYHQSINQLEDGKKTHSELLFDGKTLYMKIHGDWCDTGAMDNPFKDLATAVMQATSCTRLREETVGSQAAAVYQISQVIEDKPVQSQVWVSATGLVLHMRDTTHDDFDRTADYVGIKAPTGAKRIGS